MTHRSVAAAAAVTGMLVLLSGCGGQTSAAPGGGAGEETTAVAKGELLKTYVAQVDDLRMVEWQGQMLDKPPARDGKRVFSLSGRFSRSTGNSEVRMDSAIDGVNQQVDYLVVSERTYFNSDAWGPAAVDCWVDITGDAARTWGLPAVLDPSWPVTEARADGVREDELLVEIPARFVLSGMPRGLFPAVPPSVKGVDAKATIIPHGPLLEVAVDVTRMWGYVKAGELANINTHHAGWWAMTMREARDGLSIAPPKHVFDPAVTSPRHCMKA